MPGINGILESGETVLYRHWPDWLLFCVLGFMVLTDILAFGALAVLAADGDIELDSLRIVGVILAFTAVTTIAVLYLVLRIAVVTDRRVFLRDGILWSNPKQMRHHEIEEVRRRGGSLVISGGGRTLVIPCPAFLAPPLLAVLGRTAEVA